MCDSAVAVGVETRAGTTLFAKNSHRHSDECQPFVQFPTAHHAIGASVRCTHVQIPQVAETYAVMGHSPWWVWGFEQGVNEHAVAIGNHSVFSNEPIDPTPGLVGMDLVRLGLERGRDAREALEVIATLVETHGQGGPAFSIDGAGHHNSFLIADPSNAWILETSNRRWAARRATLDACANHLSLGRDWEIGSRDLEPFARGMGWWNASERLDLASAYRNRSDTCHLSEGRQQRAKSLLEAERGRHDVVSMQRLLRDHGEGDTTWTREVGSANEGHVSICAHGEPEYRTTASLIAPLPDRRPGPWPVWISFGAPCSGIFLPVYLDGLLPACLARNGSAAESSAWHTFKALQDAAAADPVRTTPMLREAWADLEERIEAERVEVEHAARAAAVSRDDLRASSLVTEFMHRSVDEALVTARNLHASAA